MAINEYVCYRICAYHFMYPKNHAEKNSCEIWRPLEIGGPMRRIFCIVLRPALHWCSCMLLGVLVPALWKHSSTRAIFVDISHHLYWNSSYWNRMQSIGLNWLKSPHINFSVRILLYIPLTTIQSQFNRQLIKWVETLPNGNLSLKPQVQC